MPQFDHPSTFFSWSTDSTYDTSFGIIGSTWHNAANKVAPTAARLAQGFVPSSTLAPEHVNYMFASHGNWIGFLSQSTRELELTSSIHSASIYQLEQDVATVSNTLYSFPGTAVTRSFPAMMFTWLNPSNQIANIAHTAQLQDVTGGIRMDSSGTIGQLNLDNILTPGFLIEEISCSWRQGAAASITEKAKLRILTHSCSFIPGQQAEVITILHEASDTNNTNNSYKECSFTCSIATGEQDINALAPVWTYLEFTTFDNSTNDSSFKGVIIKGIQPGIASNRS
jgi:hypothetical protein